MPIATGSPATESARANTALVFRRASLRPFAWVLLRCRIYRGAAGVCRVAIALVGALLAAGCVNAQVSIDVTSYSALWLASGLALGLAQRAKTVAT